jgi:OPT oligopeptide transporter protein
VYPQLLPQVQLFDALHRGQEAIMQKKKRLKFFWIIFVAIFVWEWFPVCALHSNKQYKIVSDYF